MRKRTHRDAERRFLVEGAREVARALDANRRLDILYVCEALGSREASGAVAVRARQAGAEIVTCSPEVFAKMAYREGADGVLAVAPQFRRGLEDLRLSPAPLLVVAEGIEKPGNLGSILRSADGAGVDAVIVCDGCTDLFNPNTVRNSMGALFSLPIAEAGSPEALRFLRARGIGVLAATPRADAVYADVDLRGGVAVVVGTEHEGLSSAWMQQADVTVRIPMRGRVDSLNVACAATLLLYEAVRQRAAR